VVTLVQRARTIHIGGATCASRALCASFRNRPTEARRDQQEVRGGQLVVSVDISAITGFVGASAARIAPEPWAGALLGPGDKLDDYGVARQLDLDTVTCKLRAILVVRGRGKPVHARRNSIDSHAGARRHVKRLPDGDAAASAVENLRLDACRPALKHLALVLDPPVESGR
jgi:hypothetical protein